MFKPKKVKTKDFGHSTNKYYRIKTQNKNTKAAYQATLTEASMSVCVLQKFSSLVALSSTFQR